MKVMLVQPEKNFDLCAKVICLPTVLKTTRAFADKIGLFADTLHNTYRKW
jgi:hypothetical protein